MSTRKELLMVRREYRTKQGCYVVEVVKELPTGVVVLDVVMATKGEKK